MWPANIDETSLSVVVHVHVPVAALLSLISHLSHLIASMTSATARERISLLERTGGGPAGRGGRPATPNCFWKGAPPTGWFSVSSAATHRRIALVFLTALLLLLLRLFSRDRRRLRLVELDEDLEEYESCVLVDEAEAGRDTSTPPRLPSRRSSSSSSPPRLLEREREEELEWLRASSGALTLRGTSVSSSSASTLSDSAADRASSEESSFKYGAASHPASARGGDAGGGSYASLLAVLDDTLRCGAAAPVSFACQLTARRSRGFVVVGGGGGGRSRAGALAGRRAAPWAPRERSSSSSERTTHIE
jgi:hypothetical protein